MPMSHAQELILAIQTNNPSRLRAVIDQLQRKANLEVAHISNNMDRAVARPKYVNDRLPGTLDLTALHVAAKLYATHCSNERLAGIYNEMVADLLEAGAAPSLEIGAVRGKRMVAGVEAITIIKHGLTVAEVCEGKLPPALMESLRIGAEEQAIYERMNRHQSTIRREETRVTEWRAKKAEREAAMAA